MTFSRSHSTLSAELDLVLHLVENVAERLIRRAQELGDVVLGAEHRAEGHRDHGELLHHRFVHELVGEHVVPRRVVDDNRRVADDGREILERHGKHALSAADADRAEVALPIASHDAVDILSTVGNRRLSRAPWDAISDIIQVALDNA